MSDTTMRRDPGPLDRGSYLALFLAPVVYATGGYGLLYLFGLPDPSVWGLVCATVLGSVLGLLLCMEALLETSRPDRIATSGIDGSLAGTAAGGTRPARLVPTLAGINGRA